MGKAKNNPQKEYLGISKPRKIEFGTRSKIITIYNIIFLRAANFEIKILAKISGAG